MPNTLRQAAIDALQVNCGADETIFGLDQHVSTFFPNAKECGHMLSFFESLYIIHMQIAIAIALFTYMESKKRNNDDDKKK